MSTIQDAFHRLVAGNQSYKAKTFSEAPNFLPQLATGQSPEVLWIGCADSRVPETTICQCKPGDIFVHRNIANILSADDISAGSVIQYGVGAVKVQRIVVCGHTSCGGANAALGDADLGETLNTWLHPMRELRRKHQKELDALESTAAKANRLAEINVRNSLEVLQTLPVVGNAMRERGLTLHGVIYDIGEGELKVLEETSKSGNNSLWSQGR
ncbi:carbonic anhydrase [Patellaria atrata CBS 101060]|uniref:Carbonic anhydrase n=1 Tax=Patellaria atrata CBS 101060 TaxID=1346257 RepID=A0A9P4SFC6_9PEZI|nr:carbonic anhydrase [Patellaria atrata CBS 101060]